MWVFLIGIVDKHNIPRDKLTNGAWIDEKNTDTHFCLRKLSLHLLLRKVYISHSQENYF